MPLITGYLDTDLPTSKIPYFGKCYETCPFTSLTQDSSYFASSSGNADDEEDDGDYDSNMYCKTSCPLTKPFVT